MRLFISHVTQAPCDLQENMLFLLIHAATVPFREGMVSLCVCLKRYPPRAAQPAIRWLVTSALSSLLKPRKYDDSTWRCPDESADSYPGDWLRAGACHSCPSRAPSVRGLLGCEQRQTQWERSRRTQGVEEETWGGITNARGGLKLFCENVSLPPHRASLLPSYHLDVVMEETAWCTICPCFTMCPFVSFVTSCKTSFLSFAPFPLLRISKNSHGK